MDKPNLISGPTGPYAHGYKMCMVRYSNGPDKAVTWHKYIYEFHYGRLQQGIHVHHKNGNKSDNHIDNLEALTNSDHTQKHSKPAPTKTYICPWCGNSFERNDRIVRHNQKIQKKYGPFCNKSCGASWGREKQLGRL